MISFKIFSPKFESAVHEGAKFAHKIYEPLKVSEVKTAIRIHLLTLGYCSKIAEKSANFIIYGN